MTALDAKAAPAHDRVGAAEHVRSPREGGPWPIFRAASDAPLHGAGLIAATLNYWRKYAVFTGRASRSEYWSAWLGLTVVYGLILVGVPRLFGESPGFAFATGSLGPALSSGLPLATVNNGHVSEPWAWPGSLTHALLFAFAIVTFVPTLSLAFRRLHDLDLPGWLGLLAIGSTPVSALLFVAALFRSRPNGARFDRAVQRPAGSATSLARPTLTVAIAIVAAVVVGTVVVTHLATGTDPAIRGSWRLTSMSGPGGAAQKLPQGPIDLTIRSRAVSGSDRCNDFQAALTSSTPWRAAGAETSTVVCGDGDQAKRTRFHQDLDSVTRAATDGETLTLTGAAGQKLVFERRPASQPAASGG